ncbi:peptidylprolyl isomerase [Asticcacaulis sp. YBE204]|uniref:peptidylprolyl isomerase n=1 Tax=Asticcacaulis sp. YBE204 TaxID=1282363 RepID=UPI000417F004|nr:peptidylprolyl isomerase [Asticcacaulis sp. YBE204]
MTSKMGAMGAIGLACAATFFAGSAFAASPGYRDVDAENTLVIDTSKGRVIVEMYPELAPQHVERMKTLTRKGFYNGLKFHRVIEGFMAQTGDPKGTGEGNSDLANVPAEFTIRRDTAFPINVIDETRGVITGYVKAMPVQTQPNALTAITKDSKVGAWGLYCSGALGMARAGDVNSANSQFFLMRNYNNVLEKKYTAFGMTLVGLDVVRKLKLGEPPVDPDTMVKVQVMADIPAAERPKIEVMDTGSSEFKALVEAKKKEGRGEITGCDIAVPVKVLP